MDGISATASFIAIAQALVAVPQLASNLRPFFTMDRDIGELLNEVWLYLFMS